MSENAILGARRSSCHVANAKIQPQNHQHVQKSHFWQKVPGVNGKISVSK